MEDQLMTCFAGAQHLGGGVLSPIRSPSKSHPFVYTLLHRSYLTDPSRNHPPNRF